MKNLFLLPVIFLLLITPQKIKAQASAEIFMLVPKFDVQSEYAEKGMGAGFNVFSNSLRKAKKEKDPFFEVRAGGGFYYSLLSKKMIDDPGDTCGINTRTAKSNVYGTTLCSRISLKYSFPVVPYADLSAGIRCFKGVVEDNIHDYYRTSHTRQGTFGIGGGALFRLQNFNFDLGVMYTCSSWQTSMMDVNSGKFEGKNFYISNTPAPKNILMVKIGLMYRFRSYEPEQEEIHEHKIITDTTRPVAENKLYYESKYDYYNRKVDSYRDYYLDLAAKENENTTTAKQKTESAGPGICIRNQSEVFVFDQPVVATKRNDTEVIYYENTGPLSSENILFLLDFVKYWFKDPANYYYHFSGGVAGGNSSNSGSDNSSSDGSSNSSNSGSSGSSNSGSDSYHSSDNNSYSPAMSDSNSSSNTGSGSGSGWNSGTNYFSNPGSNTNSYTPATVGPAPKTAPGSNSTSPAPAQNSRVTTGPGIGGR